MNYKYKDRKPSETINIINSFFISRGYEIQILNQVESDCGSWWTSIKLFYQNSFIEFANGKGATKEYSEASAFGELYERFCCHVGNIFSNTFINKKYKELKQNNYIYHPDEIKISWEDIMFNPLHKSSRINYFLESYKDSQGVFFNTYDLLIGEKIAIPYINLVSPEQKKYFVPELITSVAKSDGMAAGNSLEEALVQGCSEIVERYVWNQIYEDNNFNFIELKLDELKCTKENFNMLNNVQNLGYQIKIIDFSYTYQLPVIGLLLIDTKYNLIYLNLGAHPIFEIALERAITEMFQGYRKIQESNKVLMLPYKNYGKIFSQLMLPDPINNRPVYPENLYLSNEIKNNFNNNVFLNNNIKLTNFDLLKFYKNLFNELKWNIFYYNWSLDSKMYAVQIFVDNILTYRKFFPDQISTLNNNEKIFLYNKLQENLFLINKIIKNKQIKKQDIDFYIKNELIINFGDFFLHTDFCQPYFSIYKQGFQHILKLLASLNGFEELKKILKYDSKNIPDILHDNIYYYDILLSYGLFSNYSYEDLLNISLIFNKNYTYEELTNCKDVEYIINKIFNQYFNIYNSETYLNFIKTLS